MANLWHQLPTGPEAPQNFEIVNVIVEIPRGSRNKYEYDEKLGIIKLDRVLYSSIVYPGDYGFIPRTFYDDDDPLDILVMTNVPTFPGCVIEARPLGIFKMKDKGQPDDKILAVPHGDPLYREFHELSDVPDHFLEEVRHFFSVYKDLEGVRVEAGGWEGTEAALDRIDHAVEMYRQKFPEMVV